MTELTDFEAWPKDEYRNPGWRRLELEVLEVAVAEWKFFLRWMELYGYEEAVAVMERGGSK